MSKLRILQLLEGEGWSGGQQQVLFLTEGLNQLQNMECRLLCNPDSVLFQRASDSGLKPIPFAIKKEGDLFAYSRLRKIIHHYQPHLINTHRSFSYTQMLLAGYRFPRMKTVLTRRVLKAPNRNPFSLVKYRSPSISGYISVSQGVKKVLVQSGIDPDRIEVIPSATDLDRFKPIPPEESRRFFSELSLSPGSRLITLVGNYSSYKGQDFFLSVINRLFKNGNLKGDEVFLFVGRDTDSAQFIEKVRGAPSAKQIRLLGFREDIPDILSMSELSVNCSQLEGFAGTLRESLAVGTPAVVTDVGGNPEIVEHEKQGLVSPYGDVAGFASSIETLLFNHKLREKFKEAGLKKSQQFSVPILIKKTARYYRMLIEPENI